MKAIMKESMKISTRLRNECENKGTVPTVIISERGNE